MEFADSKRRLRPSLGRRLTGGYVEQLGWRVEVACRRLGPEALPLDERVVAERPSVQEGDVVWMSPRVASAQSGKASACSYFVRAWPSKDACAAGGGPLKRRLRAAEPGNFDR